MNSFLRGDAIKSVQTTTHAHTVERVIRTSEGNFIGDWVHYSIVELNG